MRAGPPPSAGGMSGGSGIVRRACGANCTCAACREEESGTQGSKAEQGGGGVLRRAPENAQDADLRVYPKLVLGAPDDPVERAADTAADRVVRRQPLQGGAGAPPALSGHLRRPAATVQPGMAAPPTPE